MRKQPLQFLFILMVVAVGAVVSAQLYWIFNAYTLQEENFRRDALVALQNTTSQIEDNYTCLESFNKINLKQRENILILKRNADGVSMDTIRQFAAAYTGDSLFSTNSFSSPLTATAEILVKYHYFPRSYSHITQFDNPHNSLKGMTKKQQEQFFRGNVTLTYANGEKYFLDYIDSVLTINLSNQGISSDFRFQLKDKQNDSILFRNFEDEVLLAGAMPFTSSFYQGSRFFSPQELQLWIPAQNKILLGRMGFVMVGSFLVLVLLGAVVLLIVRTLLRQKKLAVIKNDFINNMTHEFKTPICNISLALETIENSSLVNGNNGLRQYLSIINSENIRMDENVEKIMEISMMERTEVKLNMKPCNLNNIVRQVVPLFDLMIRERHGNITVKSYKPVVMVNCDAVHISNVFYNLIDNAIKYNDKTPEVNISVIEENDLIKIEFSDNGIGINQEHQKPIFDSFYRVSTGNKHDVKGFGLGLSYVKNIIESHRGDVQLNSRKGGGSVFSVRLPIETKEVKRSSRINLHRLNL
ncbi:MAG: HAMP domain-containing sensor histidine kinase [Bacteroidia bacterium]